MQQKNAKKGEKLDKLTKNLNIFLSKLFFI